MRDNEDVHADETPAPRGLNFSYVTADACARQSRASVSFFGGARDRIQVSFPMVLSCLPSTEEISSSPVLLIHFLVVKRPGFAPCATSLAATFA